MDCASLVLDVLLAIQGIGDHVADYLYCFWQVSVEGSHHVAGVLP